MDGTTKSMIIPLGGAHQPTIEHCLTSSPSFINYGWLKNDYMIEAHPLQWPIGYKRTLRRKDSSFSQTAEKAQIFLRNELVRMGTKNLIISTNVPRRNDGFLYSDMSSTKIEDPGVAIYFNYKGKDITMCCDQYNRVWENIYALGKGIEALRGMERWGVSEFLDRAFTGFKAIPEHTSYNEKNIWDILELKVKPDSVDVVHSAYKRLLKIRHPDIPATGSASAFHELQYAYTQAMLFFQT